MENNTTDKPVLSKTAFWDVDFDLIDFNTSDLYVMEKVANYGTWQDLVSVVRFYGIERFKERIVFAAYLKKDVLNFICVAFDLDIADFTCYAKRQSSPQPWNF